MSNKIIVANKFDSPENFIDKLLQKQPQIIFTKNERDILKLIESDNTTLGEALIILADFFDIRNILSVANSVSQLPGNNVAYQVINERLHKPNVKIAILYIDIDNFKAYNDKYGFERGDRVIKKTAKILTDITQIMGNPNDFVGHLGGDDFILVTTPGKAEVLAYTICDKFDQEIIKHYSKNEQKTRNFVTKDRQGQTVEYPIMTLSIAIITNEKKDLTCVAQVSQIAAELKHYAKTKPDGPGSNFVKERRK